MNRLVFISIYFISFLHILPSRAQKFDSTVLFRPWKASWIEVPDESSNKYGVYLFRKSLMLTTKPESFVIHVSADNRYKLFVNERQVSLGPARGDIDHWNFETLDLAPFLRDGKNIIAAKVWNEGEWRAEGQISLRTGFILMGDGLAQMINTNSGWKCIRDSSYRALPFITTTYYVAGPGELVNIKGDLSNWETQDYADSNWKNARVIMEGTPKNIIGGYGTVSGWSLVPSVIPQMEMKPQSLVRISRSTGVNIPAGFPTVNTYISIPKHSIATILFDQTFLTNAYPTLVFSRGVGGTISMSYAEALYTKYPSKGNRNETEGKTFIGRRDSIISNGKSGQVFTTLTFRTFRYLQLRITTNDDPLDIEDIYGIATGYPFQMNAKLESEDSGLNKILETGWRTARLCAMETYMDCPYYEQLQYIGDSRIQGLISLFNSGDERLLRNAMNAMDNSRRPEGVTLSRHPSYTQQYIPTFSLWYIGMLHDYMMYGRDSTYLKNKLSGERQILNYFRNYQGKDGSVRGVPYWMFTDWVEKKGWISGTSPVGKDGSSSLIDLQLLWAYELAADLESKFGMQAYAALYNKYVVQLKKTIRNKYWDEKRKLFADRPEKDLFSQHANALAILTGTVDNLGTATLARQILSDTTLAPASIYFKFYLHLALINAGLGNDYLNWLGLWRENIKMGMTTWAEIPDINNTRSDCHAWGASPNIEFFRTVLGIDSDAPGFTKVKIEPHLGALKNIQGEIPHPMGKIGARYLYKNGKWKIQIDLPSKTTGSFIWKSKFYPLKEGTNNFYF
ncbi:MAG TPA: alpha-L-rhamnosidase C-terminal domain-containing protein [Puia sp.]|nr:alpha-L-rhamnosidase C-terminal domain-containing protein [Puia sp.]